MHFALRKGSVNTLLHTKLFFGYKCQTLWFGYRIKKKTITAFAALV